MAALMSDHLRKQIRPIMAASLMSATPNALVADLLVGPPHCGSRRHRRARGLRTHFHLKRTLRIPESSPLNVALDARSSEARLHEPRV
jgi:hypothetical protein